VEYNVDSREVTLMARPYARMKYSLWAWTWYVGVLLALLFESFALVGIVLLPLAFQLVSWVSFRLNRRRLADFADRPGNRHLVCYGNADDLRAVADLSGTSTEPYIVQISGDTCRNLFRPRRKMPSDMTLLVVVFAFCIVVVSLSIWSFRLFLVGMALTVPAHYLAYWVLSSTYLRVAPRRIEILRFTPFRRKAQKAQPIPLANAAIEFHFDTRRIHVREFAIGGQKWVIPIGNARDAQSLARAVFTSARAPYDMPPLPDDELLG
jgi:hypothetical protein